MYSCIVCKKFTTDILDCCYFQFKFPQSSFTLLYTSCIMFVLKDSSVSLLCCSIQLFLWRFSFFLICLVSQLNCFRSEVWFCLLCFCFSPESLILLNINWSFRSLHVQALPIMLLACVLFVCFITWLISFPDSLPVYSFLLQLRTFSRVW